MCILPSPFAFSKLTVASTNVSKTTLSATLKDVLWEDKLNEISNNEKYWNTLYTILLMKQTLNKIIGVENT